MKINKVFFILSSSVFSFTCLAQSSPQLIAVKEFAQKAMPKFYDSSIDYINLKPSGNLNYLFPFYQLFKQENKFRSLENNDGYNKEMSKAASFLEDYHTVLEYQIKNYEPLDESSRKQLQKTVDDLKGIEHADAAKYISFAAKSYQVIMINESDNKGLHRAFILSLLQELYKKGFRYLAMETLNHFSKASLNKLTSSTGYFTNEAIGGELIRMALELGYSLVPFSDTSSVDSVNERDSVQAQNIYNVLLHDRSAKILVVGSYGHIAKKSADKNYVPMGMAFKKISGIEPLCIDQVSMCDESEFAYGKAFYEAYTDKFYIGAPSIAMLGSETINITNDDSYDICVIHPHTSYKDNRPTWLALGGLRQAIYVKPTVKKTFLIQAYYEDESKQNGPGQIVPADQSYIPANKDSYLLFLRKGKYLIAFRDVAYHLIGKLNIEVN